MANGGGGKTWDWTQCDSVSVHTRVTFEFSSGSGSWSNLVSVRVEIRFGSATGSLAVRVRQVLSLDRVLSNLGLVLCSISSSLRFLIYPSLSSLEEAYGCIIGSFSGGVLQLWYQSTRSYHIYIYAYGNIVVISHEFRGWPLRVGDNIRPANLLPLEMSDFDIILGMDWLTENRATIDCHTKRFVASIKYISLDGPHLESHLVVWNLPDVFPDKLSGLPTEREVEFTIELVPGDDAEPI
ncbi:putative reverse transcriptase domain-containing protein [Tanacetum coccineum]